MYIELLLGQGEGRFISCWRKDAVICHREDDRYGAVPTLGAREVNEGPYWSFSDGSLFLSEISLDIC